jgi:glycosyltransferase involved in cell wall biosynthesis
LKIAIVVDWLMVRAGAEQVLAGMLQCFPAADLFCVVDFVPKSQRGFLQGKQPKTTFIQNLPFAEKHYRRYLPLMPLAIRCVDVSSYDLVISSSHAVAKGVKTRAGQLHICYIHSPMRYAWDLRAHYLEQAGIFGIKAWLTTWVLKRLQRWDKKTAAGVDYFVANSCFIARRVRDSYNRHADVIYPPVDVKRFCLQEKKSNYYVVACRLVQYKKVDLIIEAFNQMPDKKLIVVGDGPEFGVLKEQAGENVQLVGYQSFDKLRDYLGCAKAFVYAAIEDFGILPLEAQACGTPVIAFGRGGLLETVSDQKTGLFFDEQTAAAVISAVYQFEGMTMPADVCRSNALKFSEIAFCEQLTSYVQQKYQKNRV